MLARESTPGHSRYRRHPRRGNGRYTARKGKQPGRIAGGSKPRGRSALLSCRRGASGRRFLLIQALARTISGIRGTGAFLALQVTRLINAARPIAISGLIHIASIAGLVAIARCRIGGRLRCGRCLRQPVHGKLQVHQRTLTCTFVAYVASSTSCAAASFAAKIDQVSGV